MTTSSVRELKTVIGEGGRRTRRKGGEKKEDEEERGGRRRRNVQVYVWTHTHTNMRVGLWG